MTKPTQKNYVVLAVDDSAETLGLLSNTLELAGMTTLVALEGAQGINIAQKMLPDIILLDAIMPKMDGFETCIQLKKFAALKDVPVIFMTGLSDTDSIVKGFNAGGIDFLTKPINPQELVVRMNTHLTNARATVAAKNALDTAGQNVFSVNNNGEQSWSTPEVDKILQQLEKSSLEETLMNTLNQWLQRNPDLGNKCHFNEDNINLTAIYLGRSDNDNHLIRLINDSAIDEKKLLKERFSITPREADVFLWLAKGKANREIAQILEMSPRTVNKHLEQLFKKLNVENRTAAAGLALQCLQK